MEGQLIDKDKKLKENFVQSHKQIDELEKEKQSAEARCKEYEERMKEMKFEIVGLQESNDSMGDIIDKFHGVSVTYHEERCYHTCRNAFREYMAVKKLVPERSAKRV